MKSAEGLEYRDKNGSVSLKRDGHILQVVFSGACGIGLAKFFLSSVKRIVPEFKGEPWGYLSVSPDFTAATPDAAAIVLQAYQYCSQHGCKAEAFVIHTAVARAQIQDLMQKAGQQKPIDEVLYSDAASAERAILARLGHNGPSSATTSLSTHC